MADIADGKSTGPVGQEVAGAPIMRRSAIALAYGPARIKHPEHE